MILDTAVCSEGCMIVH